MSEVASAESFRKSAEAALADWQEFNGMRSRSGKIQ